MVLKLPGQYTMENSKQIVVYVFEKCPGVTKPVKRYNPLQHITALGAVSLYGIEATWAKLCREIVVYDFLSVLGYYKAN